MTNLLKNKFFIILMSGIILMFFNISVKRIPLSNRGIVIGIGVDKSADGEGYIVTAQAILSAEKGTTDSSAGSANYFILEGEGKNLNDAILKIAAKSAITPAFKHCALIILGKELTNKDIDYVTDFFFSDNIVTDHTMLVRASEKASESLKKKIPNTTVLTFHLTRILNPKYAKLNLNSINLRQYLVLKHSNTITYLPLYRPVLATPSPGGDGDSGGKVDKEEEYYFEIYTTSVISDKGIIDLSESETAGLSVIKGHVTEGTIDIQSGERKVSYTVTTLNSKLSFDYLTYKTKVNITAVVKLNDILDNGKLSSNIIDLTDEDSANLKSKIDADLQSIFDFSKRENLDIIGIYDGYFAKGGNKFKNSATSDYLSRTSFETSYDIYIT